MVQMIKLAWQEVLDTFVLYDEICPQDLLVHMIVLYAHCVREDPAISHLPLFV